ncbi:hypothetical protein COY95_00620 [Candidatus Woesearchaeota archaeon CG_4_10_14_0_8_um_filter_47_5]|nr:MAG: hypothetical protein COY95_00620 [Candidatus Woesearchaeota archaeon CG_4_10_14_0_8_um_filter_47_5]
MTLATVANLNPLVGLGTRIVHAGLESRLENRVHTLADDLEHHILRLQDERQGGLQNRQSLDGQPIDREQDFREQTFSYLDPTLPLYKRFVQSFGKALKSVLDVIPFVHNDKDAFLNEATTAYLTILRLSREHNVKTEEYTKAFYSTLRSVDRDAKLAVIGLAEKNHLLPLPAPSVEEAYNLSFSFLERYVRLPRSTGKFLLEALMAAGALVAGAAVLTPGAIAAAGAGLIGGAGLAALSPLAPAALLAAKSYLIGKGYQAALRFAPTLATGIAKDIGDDAYAHGNEERAQTCYSIAGTLSRASAILPVLAVGAMPGGLYRLFGNVPLVVYAATGAVKPFLDKQGIPYQVVNLGNALAEGAMYVHGLQVTLPKLVLPFIPVPVPTAVPQEAPVQSYVQEPVTNHAEEGAAEPAGIPVTHPVLEGSPTGVSAPAGQGAYQPGSAGSGAPGGYNLPYFPPIPPIPGRTPDGNQGSEGALSPQPALQPAYAIPPHVLERKLMQIEEIGLQPLPAHSAPAPAPVQAHSGSVPSASVSIYEEGPVHYPVEQLEAGLVPNAYHPSPAAVPVFNGVPPQAAEPQLSPAVPLPQLEIIGGAAVAAPAISASEVMGATTGRIVPYDQSYCALNQCAAPDPAGFYRALGVAGGIALLPAAIVLAPEVVAAAAAAGGGAALQGLFQQAQPALQPVLAR